MFAFQVIKHKEYIVDEKSKSESSSLVQKPKLKPAYVEYVFVDEKTYESFLSIEEFREHYTRGYQPCSIIPVKNNSRGLAVDAACEEKKLPTILFVGKKMVTGGYLQVNIGVGGKFDVDAATEALDSFKEQEHRSTSVTREKPASTSIFACLFSCCKTKTALSQNENIEMTI